MTDLTRRVRWPVAGALTVALAAAVASSVLLAPPSPAVALAGASASAVSVVGAGKTTLTYCHNGGVAETLDVYEPSPLPSTPVPAVVYVHGGGWVQGDAALTPGSLVGQVAAAIETRGWIVVSINYRLAPRFPWPAQIDDATCAIRFLRAQAASLHIDPRHIGAIGDSAGGQIVSLLGLGTPHTGASTALQAVADLYGPADLVAADWGQDPFIQVYARQAFGTDFGP
jgi:acetyl esterase/lipase